MINENLELIKQLTTVADSLDGIDKNQLIRSSLGELSLTVFASEFEEIRENLRFAILHAPLVHVSYIANLLSIYQRIESKINEQVVRSPQDFVGSREMFLWRVRSYIEETRRYMHPFVASAVISHGILDDKGLRQEYERRLESIKTESTEFLKEIEKDAKQIIRNASRNFSSPTR